MIKVGALWSKKSQKGEEYLSGKFGDASLQVFPNGYKETDNQPDFIVYISENKDKKEYAGKSNGVGAKKSWTAKPFRKAAPSVDNGGGEEGPF